MPTLLIRLSGPLQSYGTTSCWEERATASRPTKSAVIGMVANALGFERDSDLSSLEKLRFAVRADRPGRQIIDQQTAGGGVFPHHPAPHSPNSSESRGWYGAPRAPMLDSRGTLRASSKAADRQTVLVTKHYLEDAAFLVGLTAPDQHVVEEIAAALDAPRRLVGLGRRSCPPAHPLNYGCTSHDAESWPSLVPRLPEATAAHPFAWLETPPTAGSTAASPEQVPTTFAQRNHSLMHLRIFKTTPPPPTATAAGGIQ